MNYIACRCKGNENIQKYDAEIDEGEKEIAMKKMSSNKSPGAHIRVL